MWGPASHLQATGGKLKHAAGFEDPLLAPSCRKHCRRLVALVLAARHNLKHGCNNQIRTQRIHCQQLGAPYPAQARKLTRHLQNAVIVEAKACLEQVHHAVAVVDAPVQLVAGSNVCMNTSLGVRQCDMQAASGAF